MIECRQREKTGPLVLAREASRFGQDQVGGVVVAGIRMIAGGIVGVRGCGQPLVGGEGWVVQSQPIGVVPQRRRVMIVGDALAVVTEEPVETLAQGIAGRSRAAQAPFAKRGGGVTAELEQARQGHCARGQWRLASGLDFAIVADDSVPGALTGHEHAARRGTNGVAGIMAGEPHALARQLIEIRRANLGLAVTPELSIAQIVGKDENDVGRPEPRRSTRERAQWSAAATAGALSCRRSSAWIVGCECQAQPQLCP